MDPTPRWYEEDVSDNKKKFPIGGESIELIHQRNDSQRPPATSFDFHR